MYYMHSKFFTLTIIWGYGYRELLIRFLSAKVLGKRQE